jgi:hypothetical protein
MTTTWQKMSKAAPVVTGLILLAILATGGAGPRAVPGSEGYHERVREAIEDIPYKIGDSWIGTDVDIPPAATSLLRPNKLIQRRYRDVDTGRVISVLVVHCGDVRDMVGHYPPQCYPAHGWTQTDIREASFRLAGGSFPAREYSFERVIDGVSQRMRVFGFFVLPVGVAEIVGDYNDLIRASRGRTTTSLGAAQIQILGGENLSPEERTVVIEQFLQALEPVIRVIGEGTA